jgi:ABC-type glutathione transport system ATPase component
VTLLSVANLAVAFPTDTERVNAVRGMTFDVSAGEVVALVGESGSGKSATAMAVTGLLPEYAEVSGSIRLNGDELLGLSDNQMSQIRGKSVGTLSNCSNWSASPSRSGGREPFRTSSRAVSANAW